MSSLLIVGWTNFDSGYPTADLSDENISVILPLLAKEIGENRYVFSGEAHQYAETGMPVFSDGTAFRASMRCWGSIMASLYNDMDDADYHYMDFYVDVPDQEVLPRATEIPVPATLGEEEDWSGCIVAEDQDILRETMMNRMPFLTTDKVLRVFFENISKENQ